MWILFPQNTRNPFVKLKITRGCDIKTYIQKNYLETKQTYFLASKLNGKLPTDCLMVTGVPL